MGRHDDEALPLRLRSAQAKEARERAEGHGLAFHREERVLSDKALQRPLTDRARGQRPREQLARRVQAPANGITDAAIRAALSQEVTAARCQSTQG